MLTLLLMIAVFAKFAHSVHVIEKLVVNTHFGPEHLMITKHVYKDESCHAIWKPLHNQVVCKPRERIIHLGNNFVPIAIIVKRCAGSISSKGETCGECVHRERKNVTVRAYKFESGKKTCVNITAVEDVSCKCLSKLFEPCPMDKVRDTETDKCVCKPTKCTTGTVLDQSSCKCVPKNTLRTNKRASYRT